LEESCEKGKGVLIVRIHALLKLESRVIGFSHVEKKEHSRNNRAWGPVSWKSEMMIWPPGKRQSLITEMVLDMSLY